MINYKTINKNENVMVCYSEFTSSKGVTEYQVMIQLTKPGQSYEEQLKLLLDTYSDLKENEFKKGDYYFQAILSERCRQSDRPAFGSGNGTLGLCLIHHRTGALQWYQDCTMGFSANRSKYQGAS